MDNDLRKILNSFMLPAAWVVVMWLIHIGVILLGMHNEAVRYFGLHTQHLNGLIGLLTTPFLHGDWAHLSSNSIPFLILGTAIIYFYPKLSFRVFMFSWILPSLIVWAVVSPSYHIGASGMIFAFAFFLFFSGVFRQNADPLSWHCWSPLGMEV